MKQDSCRRCGNELEVKKKCGICNNENQFYCNECGCETVEQIHFECMMGPKKTSIAN